MKTEIWNLYVKCLESKNFRTKMFEMWILKVENWNWNLNSLCEASRIWNLKTKMSEFGCVNTRSWKLKTKIEIWNLYVKCLEFESWKLKLKIEIFMWSVWNLKFEN